MIIPILASTPDWLAILKPEGIGMHQDSAADGTPVAGIVTLLQQQQAEELWPVHRLDKVTSGVLLLARNAEAAARLSQLFADHRIQKYYVARASSRPKKKQGWVRGDMEKTRNGSWRLAHSQNNPAITRFDSCYDAEQQKRLFLLRPFTGKTHQLRVALRSLGAPIDGDERYKGESADRTYLHAMALCFEDQGQLHRIVQLPVSGDWGHIPAEWHQPWDILP